MINFQLDIQWSWCSLFISV